MPIVILNGSEIQHDAVAISPDNRSFRYGDGCFETIKVTGGRPLLWSFHYDRLCGTLAKLSLDLPPTWTSEYFEKSIERISLVNLQPEARIRLTVFREGTDWQQPTRVPSFLLQGYPCDPYDDRVPGLRLGVCNTVRKARDIYANCKTNNYLPYTIALLYARDQGWDDALVLNDQERVMEATTSNLFIIKNGVVLTPGLEEGCVAGVMRRYLLESFEREAIRYVECSLAKADILDADEVFLTNTIRGITSIAQLEGVHFSNAFTTALRQRFVLPLNSWQTF